MYVPVHDRSQGTDEWRAFVQAQGFGHLIAPGSGLEYPVVAATQFVLDGDELLVHFARPNPILDALRANPRAVMSVSGDWAFIPSDWKAIRDEDPQLGIPTTYYAAVQIKGHATVRDDPDGIADVLRRQLEALQPDTRIADPLAAHPGKLNAIRAVVLSVDDVVAKFKYGGNVDGEHRAAVIDRLRARNRPGDQAAAAHSERRLGRQPPSSS